MTGELAAVDTPAAKDAAAARQCPLRAARHDLHWRTGAPILRLMNALSVRGLTKTYSNGVQALRGIDLDVERGDFFALLGPNGCLLYTSDAADE